MAERSGAETLDAKLEDVDTTPVNFLPLISNTLPLGILHHGYQVLKVSVVIAITS